MWSHFTTSLLINQLLITAIICISWLWILCQHRKEFKVNSEYCLIRETPKSKQNGWNLIESLYFFCLILSQLIKINRHNFVFFRENAETFRFSTFFVLVTIYCYNKLTNRTYDWVWTFRAWWNTSWKTIKSYFGLSMYKS